MLIKCFCGKLVKCSPSRERKYCSYRCFRDDISQHTHNQNLFSHINSETSAYWLGFVYADGSISKKERKQRSLCVQLSTIDLSHLNKLGKIFARDVKVYHREHGSLCSLTITSSRVWEDLCNIGCVPNKTFIYDEKIERAVPSSLMAHFIRGYFDGDGTVSHYRNHIGFVGHDRFLHFIRDQIADIGVSKPSIVSSSASDAVKQIYWTGRDQVRAIGDWLYSGSTVFLERKKVIFDSITTTDRKLGYRGVSMNRYGRFTASIYHDGRVCHLGTFKTAEEAAHAYDDAALQFNKPQYRMNFR